MCILLLVYSVCSDSPHVNDDGFNREHAKWVWKCSALVGVTLKDHLVGVHFEQANDLFKVTIEQLPAAHPVRRLLLPHIYATPSINSGAAITLATEFGILHHAVALEWQALKEAFVASRKALRTEPLWLDEHLQKRGMGDGDTDKDSMFYPCKSLCGEFRSVQFNA